MSVIEVRGPLYATLTSRDDITGVREYESQFMAICDDPNDGPQIVREASGLPRYGDPWRTPNEIDLDARLVGRDTRTDPENACVHILTFKYSTDANAADGQAGAGAVIPEQQEIDLAPEIEWDFVEREVATIHARRAELWQGDKRLTVFAGKRTNGRVPIRNSAGDIFDPPLVDYQARLVLRISRAVGSYNPLQAAEYAYVLNSDTWLGFEPGTLLLYPIRAKTVFNKGLSYYRTNTEIHIRFDGHAHDILDMGMREYLTEQEIKDNPKKWKSRTPGYNEIQNARGQAVSEPVHLDGYGHALVPPGGVLNLKEAPPCWWRFFTLRSLPFGPLKLL